jgi:hypothetical protein
MAFARSALVLHLFDEHFASPTKERLLRAARLFISEAFKDQDTGETNAFYGSSLKAAVWGVIAIYAANTFPRTQLASTLGLRLQVSGYLGVEILPVFEDVEKRFHEGLRNVKIT